VELSIEALLSGPITAFLTTPRLRKLTPLGLEPRLLQISWSQLTNLAISGIHANECLNGFLQCTNLVDCTLFLCDSELDGNDMPIVILPYLRNLKVTFYGWGRCAFFFRPLNLPALKHLDLTMDLFYGSWDQQAFIEFTRRSTLDLERLSLSDMTINSDGATGASCTHALPAQS